MNDDNNDDVKIVRFNNKELHIQQFHLSQMVSNPAILMIGKRGNGKSWICRSLIKYLRDIPCGIAIAPTEKVAEDPFYEEFIPNSYIYYDFKPEIFEKVLYRQDAMLEKVREKKKQGKVIDPRIFILMDDCLSQKNVWKNEQTVHELLFNGRHYKITYILTSQTTMGPPSEIRNNFDYIFILACDNHIEMKKIQAHYAGMFPSYESFRQTFNVLTENYCAMVVANRGARQHFTEKIFWYKAQDEEPGFVGCKLYQNNHKKNYDENWRKKNKCFTKNIDDIIKKKK